MTTPEAWWDRLSPLTRQLLAEQPSSPVPPHLWAEVSAAGRGVWPKAAWHPEPLGGPYYLPDDIQHWLVEQFGPLDEDVLTFEGKTYPLISTRKNGDRLIGYRNTEAAQDLHATGLPPVHGLSRQAMRSNRVAAVRIGDLLAIERRGQHWVVSDSHGELGVLRWSHTDEGKTYVATGKPMHFPDIATLRVKRLIIDKHGIVVDFAGISLER